MSSQPSGYLSLDVRTFGMVAASASLLKRGESAHFETLLDLGTDLRSIFNTCTDKSKNGHERDALVVGEKVKKPDRNQQSSEVPSQGAPGKTLSCEALTGFSPQTPLGES